MGSYRLLLKKQIAELEERIKQDQQNKEVLEKELTKLKIAEWEEDAVDSRNEQLLKG